MSDKTLRVVTYAAGASLAAITLIYVFGPTYFLDSDTTNSASGPLSHRKGGVVGLSNPANDCFVNSVLQALAGLGDLRLYLIQEIHRRSLDDESVYSRPVHPGALARNEDQAGPLRFGQDIPDWKLEGLQRGNVTRSLKEILDALNERPIYRKTISAAPFLRALEEAFRQRISRQQQDAQEFLQVVAERLCDEYHAGRRARWFARRTTTADGRLPKLVAAENGDVQSPLSPCVTNQTVPTATKQALEVRDDYGRGADVEEEEGFPLEGRFESQIECLTCGFKPRPAESTFCTLTLNVPHVPTTTLGGCFDGMFKTEYIDDFKCEKCRLLHAVSLVESERQRSTSDAARAKASRTLEKLRLALDTDPERPPEDLLLPDVGHAPKRRIARHIRLTVFPKILAIHLSRSIFDVNQLSQKNSAKVAFPEELPLGGLLRQRKYKLLSIVTHKGSHHSGHYETFRRLTTNPPFSNPSTFQASGIYSRTASPTPKPPDTAQRQGSDDANALTPVQDSVARESGLESSPPTPSTTLPVPRLPAAVCAGAADPEPASDALHSRVDDTATVSMGSGQAPARLSSPATPSGPSPRTHTPGTVNDRPAPTRPTPTAKSKQRKPQARWWRISDDKVKEASTRDVLGMQREVYLLFYELEKSML